MNNLKNRQSITSYLVTAFLQIVTLEMNYNTVNLLLNNTANQCCIISSLQRNRFDLPTDPNPKSSSGGDQVRLTCPVDGL